MSVTNCSTFTFHLALQFICHLTTQINIQPLSCVPVWHNVKHLFCTNIHLVARLLASTYKYYTASPRLPGYAHVIVYVDTNVGVVNC